MIPFPRGVAQVLPSFTNQTNSLERGLGEVAPLSGVGVFPRRGTFSRRSGRVKSMVFRKACATRSISSVSGPTRSTFLRSFSLVTRGGQKSRRERNRVKKAEG